MANINKDYLVIADLKSSKVSSPTMVGYNTDKRIFNIFTKLQITMSSNPDIKVFVTREEALNYTVKLTVIKPRTNQLRYATGELMNSGTVGNGAVYQFDLGEEFTDQVGKYICELTVTCNVNGYEELITCDPFYYTIKPSAVTGLNDELTRVVELPILEHLIDDVERIREEIIAGNLSEYQTKRDVNLQTDSKEIIGAINEVTEQLNNTTNDVNEQLDTKANKSEVDAQFQTVEQQKATRVELQSVASGSPKGVYPTLLELQTAFPTGTSGMYIVSGDGGWYYWNNSAWERGGTYQSTGIPDDLVFRATNLMQNSDFKNGVTGWSVYGGTGAPYSISNGVISVTGNGANGLVGIHNAVGYRYSGKAKHKIYAKVKAKVTNPDANSIRFYASDGTNNVDITGKANAISNPIQNTEYNISGIFEQPSVFEGKAIQHFILAGYSSAAITQGKTVEISKKIAINLTEIFGFGNEPTLEEVEKTLSIFENGWFDGTKDILGVKKYVQDLNDKINILQQRFEKATPYKLYDDFTTSTWTTSDTATTSLSKDKRKVITGNESLKITVSNSQGISRAVDKNNVALSTDGNTRIMLKVWIDEPSKIEEINLYFGNDESAWNNFCRIPIKGKGEGNATSSGGLLRKGWNFIPIISNELIVTGNFSWNNLIKKVRITLKPTTNESTSIIVDSLWCNGSGTPKLVITFDDGWKTVYQNAFPIMEARGIKGTTYAIGQYTDNPSNPMSPDFCTVSELKQLMNKGWTIGNHTWQHNYYYSHLVNGEHFTPASYVAVIDQNRDWLLKNDLGGGCDHVCYPGGEYDLNVVRLLKAKGYKSARAAKPRWSHGIEIDDHFQILSRNFFRDVTLEQAKKWVDDCVETNGTTFLQFHQIPLDDTTSNGYENPSIAWSKAKFEALMDYIVAKGMVNNCLTHEEWYDWVKSQNLITL